MSNGSSCTVFSIALHPATSALLSDIASLVQGQCCPSSLAPGTQGWALGQGFGILLWQDIINDLEKLGLIW